MQIVVSIGNNHFMYRGMVVGGEVRSALISIIFGKAMTIAKGKRPELKPPLQPPADINPGSDEEKKWYEDQLKKQKREKKDDEEQKDGWSNGRIVNLMSTDTYRIDQASGWFHIIWTYPVAIIVTMVLLIINLTYSALPGIGLFLLSVPIMGMVVRLLFARRANINKLTDKRVSLTQEVLQAIRFVKYYAWEMDFLSRIADIRRREIRSIQILLATRNAINSVGMSIPIFASMLAFITYSLSKHALDPATIFSSLTLFNQLRLPLNLLPMVIGLVTDAFSSISRIEQFLLAEDKHDSMELVEDAADAINISHAEFTWERAMSRETDEEAKAPATGRQLMQQKKNAKKAAKKAEKAQRKAAKKGQAAESTFEIADKAADEPEPEPFKITDINITIGRREFVGVVGGVGSGKSSLLAALAGDMRQISGSATIGGSRAYCPQSAWIQNATVQDNIVFGRELDESRFDQVVDACSLRHDLDILPHGRFTEIGERGINLSGGQKQRVNLARAIYSDAQIMLMDDPLSAVDAHVGRHIMEHAILGLLKDKCRILATHQLHILNRCDRIIMMNDGKISAFDTFDNLMAHNEEFRTMMATVDVDQQDSATAKEVDDSADVAAEKPAEDSEDSLMQEEERASENVGLKVYYRYFKASGSFLVLPLIFLLLIVAQGTNIVTNLWLTWWTSDKFGFSTGKYVSCLTSHVRGLENVGRLTFNGRLASMSPWV